MPTLVEEWTAIADTHRKKLAEAEAKIEEYKKSPQLLSDFEMKAAILAMETRPAYKMGWKVVLNDLYECMKETLEDSYSDFQDPAFEGQEIATAAKNVLGAYGSVKWQTFVLKVIQYLHHKGLFQNEDDDKIFDRFENMYYGDDDVWNAGLYIIQNPTWTPSS